MRKTVGIILAIVIIVIIFAGLFAYSYNQLSINLNDVNLESIDLVELSWSTLLNLGLNTLSGNWLEAAFDLIHRINLNLIFELSNDGFVPIYIPDISYELSINDVLIGSGNSKINTTINPGQTIEIVSLQNIQKSSLLPTVNSIINTQGIIDLEVKGTAYFQLLGLSVPVPFETTKQVSIYDEIQSKINEVQNN